MLINAETINSSAINGNAGSARVFSNLPSHWVSTHYRCFLTGAENGLTTDIELLITSFQSRLRYSLYSYLSCVIKGAAEQVGDIVARNNGKLKVYREYINELGVSENFLMSSGSLETISQQTGGRSGLTITLSAVENFMQGTSQTIALKNCTYYANEGIKRRYRCEIDPRLRPKDVAIINGDTIEVGEIIYIVDVKTAVMEIVEL